MHLGAPSSPVAYYQQVGRAGRATENADVLLLPGTEDPEIWRYFATASMPTQDRAERVIAELGDDPLSTPALEALVDIRRTPLELLLKVLDVDGAVRRVRGRMGVDRQSRGPTTPSATSASRRHAQVEQQPMLDYEQTAGAAWSSCSAHSTTTPPRRAGAATTARASGIPPMCGAGATASAERLARARRRTDRTARAVADGRRQLGIPLKGRIAAGERAETGRALARLTDLGWGGTLRSLFDGGSATPERMPPITDAVRAAAIRVLGDWGWDERPAAVVAMPSRRRPAADRLPRARPRRCRAACPFSGTLGIRNGGPTGDAGGNSVYRLAGLWDRFDASALEIPAGPVLLVDDIADSRWTLTVASRELRRAGASAVLPFTLALRA